MCWHINVLEMVIPPIRSVTARARDGEGACSTLGVGITRYRGHQCGTNCTLEKTEIQAGAELCQAQNSLS